MATSTERADRTPAHSQRPAWTEQYVGGSPDRERVAFEALATEIMRVQLKNRKAARAHGVRHGVDRAFHAKTTFAVDDAELVFHHLPPDLEVGFARSGAVYPALVRFSNAAGTVRPDADKDLRGVALRVTTPTGEQHDLLATNFPVSHARDARQFVRFARRHGRRHGLADRRPGRAGGQLRSAGDAADAMQCDRRSAHHRQHRDRDVLEPRRDRVGRGARRPLPAPAPTGTPGRARRRRHRS